MRNVPLLLQGVRWLTSAPSIDATKDDALVYSAYAPAVLTNHSDCPAKGARHLATSRVTSRWHDNPLNEARKPWRAAVSAATCPHANNFLRCFRRY